MAPAELLQGAVERTVLPGPAGKSGAGLERVRLEDGRVLVVKRVHPDTDLTLRLTGATLARDHVLRTTGVLDRLPRGVAHAVVDSWVEDGTTVVVMEDLTGEVMSWRDHLDRETTWLVVDRVARLHRAFLGSAPSDLAPLDEVLTLFAPRRIRDAGAGDDELMRLALRGWELFGDLVDADVADRVMALLDDAHPLAGALAQGPVTLVHGDLATVNMAVRDDHVVLLDWALATAAPGALDVARFLAQCASVVTPGREELLATYAGMAGPAWEPRSARLAMLAALMWLGWNKALDVAENPDPAVRARERADLDWWVARARTTLDAESL